MLGLTEVKYLRIGKQDGGIWELSVDCEAANRELSSQVSSNEKAEMIDAR